MRVEQEGDVMEARRQKSLAKRIHILLEESLFHLCNGKGVSHILIKITIIINSY